MVRSRPPTFATLAAALFLAFVSPGACSGSSSSSRGQGTSSPWDLLARDDPEPSGVAPPSPARYYTGRCTSRSPIGTQGWDEDCTPDARQQASLKRGEPMQEIVARWGEPDRSVAETCGRRAGTPWSCRSVTYGACSLLFREDRPDRPLVNWVCRDRR